MGKDLVQKAQQKHHRMIRVLTDVAQHRVFQELRYGHVNDKLQDGTGPEVRWLGPYTSHSAEVIEAKLRADYEEYEEEVGLPTWCHLVREEIGEAFKENDPVRLREELIQVAALCVSWCERIDDRGE
jgi:hypothetical protein